MMAAVCKTRIAYLAPELPALSATFVYEELLGLERRGFAAIPISVRRPAVPALEQSPLLARTMVLYDGSSVAIALRGLRHLPEFHARLPEALRWLLADMAEIGWLNRQAWKLPFQFLASGKLAWLLRQQGCSHLHVHFAHVPTQIAMYASALGGIPFTVMGHANDIFERGLLLPRKAARAKKFLTISEHNCDYLKRIGVAADRLAVVRCGVSFDAVPATQQATPRECLRLGTLGRMVEKKGMDILIRAIADLGTRPYSVELDIAGDGPLRADLERLTAELGLAGSVRFVGSLAHGQVAEWMRSLDAFVLACKRDANGDMDGIPVVLMEAMSQAVPVISTRLSGIPELVIHEQTGLLAEPGDHRDLARQIDRLFMSEDKGKQFVGRAIDHVTREFGREVNLDRLTLHFDLTHSTSAS